MSAAAPWALEIADLSVDFAGGGRRVPAVRDLSLRLRRGECVGVVGESGSGKTQLFMAAMGLLPAGAAAAGSVRFQGVELLGAPDAVLNAVRGSKLAMIFQDPLSSLTPHLRIGVQLAEVLVCHAALSWHEAERAALDMLRRVRIPDAARRLRQYPHELSGGMRQRVAIAMSLLCEPQLVIADEPTTALDVTVQAEIVGLLREMRHDYGTGMVLISHDLGVVAGLADRIVVMYAGRIVEDGPAAQLLRRPLHPYTEALVACMPRIAGPLPERLATLPGQPPAAGEGATGCAFALRCPRASARCADELPRLGALRPGHEAACHHPAAP